MPPDPSKTSPAAIEQETSPKSAAQGMRAIREPMANFFFYIVQLQGEIVIAAVLPLPASPRLLSANSLSFCSTSKYSHRTPKKALSLS